MICKYIQIIVKYIPNKNNVFTFLFYLFSVLINLIIFIISYYIRTFIIGN